MLQYYYLVAIFTLASVLVIYVIVLDLDLNDGSFLTPGSCIFRLHSDTAACLVNRGKSEKKKKEGFGFNNVAFQWLVIT